MASNDVTKKTTLTSEDLTGLNDILLNDLISNGIDPENVSLLSPVGMMMSIGNTLFTTTKNTIDNIKREMSVITAQNNSSLYLQLIQVTNDMILCTPSTLDLFIKLPIDDIERLGTLVQANTWELQFTSHNQVEIDGILFIPEIPVHYIRLTKRNGRKEIRVFYLNKENIPVNLIVQYTTVQGQAVFAFVAKFRQITIEEEEFTFSDDQLDKFIVHSKNPIHDFQLFYRPDQASAWTPLGKRLYFTRGTATVLEYKILSNTRLSIEHKYTNGGFKPRTGGYLRVVMETTTGRNVKFKGAAIPKDTYPLDLQVEYLPLNRMFESKGGRLAPDNKEDIRSTIIKLRGTRRRIDTEGDFGTFLLNYRGSSVFVPRLTINDVKARIVNIYTILSFNTKIGENETRTFTIPTSSGTVGFDLKKLTSKDIQGETWTSITSQEMILSHQDKEGNTVYTYDESIQTPPKAPVKPVKSPGESHEEFAKKMQKYEAELQAFKAKEEGKYYYVSPFIYSYLEQENFSRTYMDGQYDTPYICWSAEEIEHEDVITRFVNTTLRMYDYLDDKKQRQFYVESEIRVDNEEFIISDKNFKCILRCKDVNGKPVTFQGTPKQQDEDPQKYTLHFDIKTDRRVYGTCFIVNYAGEDGKSHVSEEKILPVTQKCVLELYTAKEQEEHPGVYNPMIKVSSFSADFSFFREVSPMLFMQTNMNYNGKMDFILMPLVSYDFYQFPRNKREIFMEIENIFSFLKTEVYDQLDMFSRTGFTMEDLQETNFQFSIKFAKTYGRSKFLNVGNDRTVPIKNLQLKPSFFLRKLDSEFDETAIASELNERLISHDYLMTDLHMSELVRDVLIGAEGSVQHIQFINFDEYPSDYHLIKRNEVEMRNEDVPEIVSIEPILDEELGIYRYNIEFKSI